MLQEIKIANEASYSAEGETLTSLKPLNFIFGTNGAGKTTISRVIDNPALHPSATLKWHNGKTLTCFVYNIDFVFRNFADQMPGVFTLGESAADVLVKIEDSQRRISDFEIDIARRRGTLGPSDASSGKRKELRDLHAQFESDCWKIKLKYDSYFFNAFVGVRSSKEKFCHKILVEAAANSADLVTFDELKRKAAMLFEAALERRPSIPMIDVKELLNIEAAPVLAKKVIGKEDVDVAALISRLGNSDWIRQGLPYLGDGPQCPFCQQEIDAERISRLNDYFDETYLRDMADISTLADSYRKIGDAVTAQLQEILALDVPDLDRIILRSEVEQVIACLSGNNLTLESKMREPSAPVKLEPLADVIDPVIARITAGNSSIEFHNKLIDNISAERRKFVLEVWKFLTDGNNIIIENYIKEKKKIDKAILGLEEGILEKEDLLRSENRALAELQKRVTSVQPTVIAINSLLRSFGFSGFSLKTADGNDHLYEIVRDNGSSAAKTLSEGEKSFLCFLYFFYLLRGSRSASDVISDRLVVFDDPVSSLDSDVLFIVSSLIKKILNEACNGTGSIKQVFVLTHNIYFHKEVCFDPSRGTECRAHETFWIVRKVHGVSKITGYNYNPIKTAYELLWSEVRNPNRSNLTIPNTLRRIIENYFKILGNVDRNEIIGKFEGRDQQVCASLFSWVNDGSHSAHDDLYISTDDSAVAPYLEVFRSIFEKTGHGGHYEMMMRH